MATAVVLTCHNADDWLQALFFSQCCAFNCTLHSNGNMKEGITGYEARSDHTIKAQASPF